MHYQMRHIVPQIACCGGQKSPFKPFQSAVSWLNNVCQLSVAESDTFGFEF